MNFHLLCKQSYIKMVQQLSYCIVMVVGPIDALYHVVQQCRCTKIKCCGTSCERFVNEETVKTMTTNIVKYLLIVVSPVVLYHYWTNASRITACLILQEPDLLPVYLGRTFLKQREKFLWFIAVQEFVLKFSLVMGLNSQFTAFPHIEIIKSSPHLPQSNSIVVEGYMLS